MSKEEIKLLANSPTLKFTAALKRKLRLEADEYGITIPQCGCRDKWKDLLLQLYYIKIRAERQSPFVFLKSKPVLFRNISYNSATPEAEIRYLRATNPLLFKKLYKEV